jgi:hypothetical protein
LCAVSDRRDVAQIARPALRAESLDREADERALGVSAVTAMDLFLRRTYCGQEESCQEGWQEDREEKKEEVAVGLR